jgi:hypothetical protein
VALLRDTLPDDHDDVLALPDVSIPARKQLGAAESGACTDLIRCGQGLRKTWPVLGQKIGMPLSNVTLPFRCQLDFTIQVRDKETDESCLSVLHTAANASLQLLPEAGATQERRL